MLLFNKEFVEENSEENVENKKDKPRKTLSKELGLIVGVVVIIALIIIVAVYVIKNISGSNSDDNYIEVSEYMSDYDVTYSVVGYGELGVDCDSSGEKLSLLDNDVEKEFDKGFFAHAYSTIMLADLKDKNVCGFVTYYGIHSSARGNPNTALRFSVYFDQTLVFESGRITCESDMGYIKLYAPEGVDRNILVVDDLGSDANDHAVWADTQILIAKEVK